MIEIHCFNQPVDFSIFHLFIRECCRNLDGLNNLITLSNNEITLELSSKALQVLMLYDFEKGNRITVRCQCTVSFLSELGYTYSMYAYILLLFAILTEIIATSCLKLSYGFTKLVPSVIVVSGYSISFWLMGLALKTLPVSVVYAVWSGLGIVGIALIGVIFFSEAFGIWHFMGTTLILIGVVVLCWITK